MISGTRIDIVQRIFIF